MPFIIDKKLPEDIKIKLSEFDSIIDFESKGIVDDYLSGHPDLFFCKLNDKIIASPNTPEKYIRLISKYSKLTLGEKAVGNRYPECAFYNAGVSDNLIVHKQEITDKQIINATQNFNSINVNQGMTRCSLLLLPDKKFITSDKGIYKTLTDKELSGFYFNPKKIILPGMSYGLFGGCTGIYNNKILLTGVIEYHEDGKKLKDFLQNSNLEFIQLYDGPLFDGGSIIHI